MEPGGVRLSDLPPLLPHLESYFTVLAPSAIRPKNLRCFAVRDLPWTLPSRKISRAFAADTGAFRAIGNLRFWFWWCRGRRRSRRWIRLEACPGEVVRLSTDFQKLGVSFCPLP